MNVLTAVLFITYYPHDIMQWKTKNTTQSETYTWRPTLLA